MSRRASIPAPGTNLAASGPTLGLAADACGRGWSLVAGDALALLGRIPAGSVDLVFADPPYRLSNGGTTCHGGRRVSVNKGAWDVSRGVAEDHAFHREWLRGCQRVLKASGTLWVSGTQHAIFSIGFALQELGFRLLNTISWFKPNGSPSLACRFFTHSSELLIWASPVQATPLPHAFAYAAMKTANGGKQMRDVWEISERPEPGGKPVVWSVPTPGSAEKTHGRHPTQKPLALMERVILASTVRGAVVLDPFCGSGTTGVAAVAHGRSFVGIEREPTFVDLARRRLESADGEDGEG
jgi:site-specific DNA-methyltransferase (adenine-specific)